MVPIIFLCRRLVQPLCWFAAGLIAAPIAAAASAAKVMRIPVYPGRSIQGMCITADGYLLQLHDHGYCRIFDFKSRNPAPLADFPLGSSGNDNHANAVALSDLRFKGNRDFPLLYVTGGMPNGAMECHVENILRNGDRYLAERVQRIVLADEFRWDMAPGSTYKTADGFYRIWGSPSWLIDNGEKCLYILSAIYRTTIQYAKHKDENRYVVTKLRLPDIAEGDVVLSRRDVRDQIVYDFAAFVTQSGCLEGSKIYFTFGFGRTRESLQSSQIRVFDLNARTITQSFDLAEIILEELEACAFYQEALYVMTAKGNLYEIER